MDASDENTEKIKRVKQIYAEFLAKLRTIEQEERSLVQSIMRQMDERRIDEIRRKIKDIR